MLHSDDDLLNFSGSLVKKNHQKLITNENIRITKQFACLLQSEYVAVSVHSIIDPRR